MARSHVRSILQHWYEHTTYYTLFATLLQDVASSMQQGYQTFATCACIIATISCVGTFHVFARTLSGAEKVTEMKVNHLAP